MSSKKPKPKTRCWKSKKSTLDAWIVKWMHNSKTTGNLVSKMESKTLIAIKWMRKSLRHKKSISLVEMSQKSQPQIKNLKRMTHKTDIG